MRPNKIIDIDRKRVISYAIFLHRGDSIKERTCPPLIERQSLNPGADSLSLAVNVVFVFACVHVYSYIGTRYTIGIIDSQQLVLIRFRNMRV